MPVTLSFDRPEMMIDHVASVVTLDLPHLPSLIQTRPQVTIRAHGPGGPVFVARCVLEAWEEYTSSAPGPVIDVATAWRELCKTRDQIQAETLAAMHDFLIDSGEPEAAAKLAARFMPAV